MTPGAELAAANAWRAFPHTFAYRLSAERWKKYRWLAWLSRELAREIAKGGARLLISAPVRHGKSELISKWLPVWFLDWFPEKRVILTSYEADFAETWGRAARNIISENADRVRVRIDERASDALNVQLAPDSMAAKWWHTTAGGGMATAGVGGPITGKGGDLIIVDDPLKNDADADSAVMRERAKNWFSSTLLTRQEPGASVIVMMARWHTDDLYGYIKATYPGTWREIRLPAIAEANDPTGREPGEALCPERYDRRALDALKANIMPRWWNALYEQRPTTAEGDEIKRQWWKYYGAAPESFDFKALSIDCTFKDSDSSDFVVMQLWGVLGRRRYLVHQLRARMTFTETLGASAALLERFKPHVTLIEDKANGTAVIEVLRRTIPAVVAIEPRGSKVARARAVAPQVEAGDVYLPSSAPWLQEYVEEFAAFPLGAHDDQVDATSQALTYLAHMGAETELERQRGDNTFVPPDLIEANKARGIHMLGQSAAHLTRGFRR